MIIKAINDIFYFYYILIIIRIFLTWIPTINWDAQPIKTVREITDIYLNIFRRLIPPLGGIDFSPIIALVVLQFVQILLTGILDIIF